MIRNSGILLRYIGVTQDEREMDGHWCHLSRRVAGGQLVHA